MVLIIVLSFCYFRYYLGIYNLFQQIFWLQSVPKIRFLTRNKTFRRAKYFYNRLKNELLNRIQGRNIAYPDQNNVIIIYGSLPFLNLIKNICSISSNNQKYVYEVAEPAERFYFIFSFTPETCYFVGKIRGKRISKQKKL